MVAVWVAEVSYSRAGDSSRWPDRQLAAEGKFMPLQCGGAGRWTRCGLGVS